MRDSQGGLHAVWLRDTDNRTGPERLVYAYCGGGCTQRANWRLEVFLEEDLSLELPALAVSPGGQPAVVYALGYYGAYARYYLFRQGDGWARRKLAEDAYWTDFQLAMGPDGAGQLAFRKGEQGRYVLVYLRCSGYACEQWNRVDLAPATYGARFSLALSSRGSPRLAFYYGRDSSPDGRAYYYLACEGGRTSEGNWQGVQFEPLPQGREVVGLALALDPQDRPCLALGDNYQVQLLSCDGGAPRPGPLGRRPWWRRIARSPRPHRPPAGARTTPRLSGTPATAWHWPCRAGWPGGPTTSRACRRATGPT